MSWTATLTVLRQEGADWKCEIVYTSGRARVVKSYRTAVPTDAWVLGVAQGEIASLAAATAAAPTLTEGTVLNALITPPAPPAVEPVDSARIDWRRKYQRYLSAKRGVDSGMLDASVLPDLQQAARVAFKPEYGNEL